MVYSCAYFESPDATLADAQTAKLDRICRALELAPGDRLLEIGTGWGALAIHAAREYGAHVTTTTISRSSATSPSSGSAPRGWATASRCCSRTTATWAAATTSSSRSR